MSIITPRTAGFDLKKSHTCVKYKAYSNKLMHEHDLDRMIKNTMSCDVSHIETRDKGGLMWPSKITALLTGLIMIFFEKLLNSEEKFNACCLSFLSSRTALKTLKETILEIKSNSCVFNVFKENANVAMPSCNHFMQHL